MNSFESFIESDAFFPVLILLLVMLVLVFVWIVLSNKNESKQKKEKKNIQIDENAKIKIVSDGIEVPQNKIIEEPVVEEPGRDEIAIVEEVSVTNDELTNNNLDENTVLNDEINNNEQIIDDPKLEEENVIVDLPIPKVEDEPIEIPTVNEVIDEGEEVEIPVPTIANDENVTSFENIMSDMDVEVPTIENNENIDINDEVVIPNAFDTKPDDNHEVNEEVNAEYPNEYTSEKTEIFEFPAFKEEDVISSTDVETEIINAANEYIKNIMSRQG